MENPALAVRAPRGTLKPIEPYTVTELHALLATARRPRDRAMLLLLVATGLRASELLRLTAADVDLERGVLRVRGKGGKLRLVAPGEAAMAALRDYLARRSLNIWQEGLSTTSGLRHWLGRLGKRAGVTRPNLHRFRHTFASAFLDAGGGEGELQMLLGHATLAMTLHYSAHRRTERALEQQRQMNPADRLLQATSLSASLKPMRARSGRSWDA